MTGLGVCFVALGLVIGLCSLTFWSLGPLGVYELVVYAILEGFLA